MDRLSVFLTVDVEIWPYKPGWPRIGLTSAEKDLTRQFGHCVLGETTDGELGLPYQLATLNRYGLRATFFVEALHAAAIGFKWLEKTIAMVQEAGHDIQLHAHTEWLTDACDTALPRTHAQYMWELSPRDQERVLLWIKHRFEQSGVKHPCAFRAGNFGANLDTLRALKNTGIFVDSSYNAAYLGHKCRIAANPEIYQRTRLAGVEEFPITTLRGWSGRFRPMHLVALSWREIERTLEQAQSRSWDSFVLLWHGWDLLQPGFKWHQPARPSSINLERFERLCRFLSENSNRFQTMLFGDRQAGHHGAHRAPAEPLTSTPMLTAQRFAEQFVGRYFG